MSNEATARSHRPAGELTPRWAAPPPVSAMPPNVIMIVLDDVGFAQLGCYGSQIDTPHLDSLVDDGLLYTNFHSTAMCSPSRACILTGRNHHSVGVGAITHYTNGFENNRGKIHRDAATLPELLRGAGYATMAVGKWHLTPPEETNACGPFDSWPLGRGFERFYGFLDSMTDQWTPDLYRDNHRLDLQPGEGYHLSEDLTDQAITMVRQQRSLAPQRPFFLQLAYGACHAPHQAPVAYRQKYRNRFDHGWDEARERCFARQRQLGVIPAGTELAPRNPGVPLWSELTDRERDVFAREQEAFAAFMDHTDACIGRLIGELERLGISDSTMVIAVSDNGASGDAGEGGTLNELRSANQAEPGPSETEIDLDDIGGTTTWNEYPRGWAMAGNTPLRWYKRNVYGGGARVPLIIRYPDRITTPGPRHQFHHMIDLMPTVLELAGVSAPDHIGGRAQIPIHGNSMCYSFDEPGAPSSNHVQYFEMLGDRGIWSDGWKAVTLHEPGADYDDDTWALFDLDNDFSESRDLAEQQPEKLRQLVDLWWEQAQQMGVLPLDDRQGERHRLMPPWLRSRTRWTFYADVAPVTGDCIALIDRSYRITASVDVPPDGAEGVLIALGGRFGGSVLFVQGGRLVHDYNRFGEHLVMTSDREISPGSHLLSLHFERTEAHGGIGELRIDDLPVASQQLSAMISHWMGPEPATIGHDGMSAVSTRYDPPYEFTGTLHHVQVDLGPESEDSGPTAYLARLERQ